MADVGVVNASPLIFLCRGGHLPLLRTVAAQVWVPRAVAEELRVLAGRGSFLRRGPLLRTCFAAACSYRGRCSTVPWPSSANSSELVQKPKPVRL